MVYLSTLQGVANYRQRVELDGVNFLLDLRWNARNEGWQLSLFTAEETPLVQGLTVVSNRPLLDRWRSLDGMPAGEILALDETNTIAVPGYDQLGRDQAVQLIYVEAADLVA